MKRSMTLFTSMTLCHFTNDPWHMTSTTLQGEIMWNLFLNTSNSLFNMSILEDEREFHEGELSSTRAVMLLIGLWKTKNDSVVSLTHNAGTKCMYFYQIWGGCAHRGRQDMLLPSYLRKNYLHNTPKWAMWKFVQHRSPFIHQMDVTNMSPHCLTCLTQTVSHKETNRLPREQIASRAVREQIHLP